MKYTRGKNPNSRNGFNKHKTWNHEKRVQTEIERYGKCLPRHTQKHSEESNLKNRLAHLGKQIKPRIERNCLYCNKIMLLTEKQSIKRKFCSYACNNAKMQKRNTSIELKIKEFLKENNINFTEQYILKNRFIFDFYIKGTNILIECDGDYWHSLPKRIKLDKEKDITAIENGFKVIRLKEIEIRNNFNKCKNNILEVL